MDFYLVKLFGNIEAGAQRFYSNYSKVKGSNQVPFCCSMLDAKNFENTRDSASKLQIGLVNYCSTWQTSTKSRQDRLMMSPITNRSEIF